jgi:mannose-6-phosphate isomerase
MPVYPLIFEPILKHRIWGGRRLESQLRKRLPPGEIIGESWEVADLEDDQSIVAVGPEKGRTLGQLVRLWGEDLVGRTKLIDGRFPLLIKFLDASQPLSVQVHPDLAAAARLGGRVRIKNEAWYVIDADPDAWILRGVRADVDDATLRSAIDAGRVESVLNRLPARPGHCYYLPSGTVHALGPGVLMAEVQTPADVTYRLHDWGRTDPATGRPRELHIDDALASIRYDAVPASAEQLQHVASVWTSISSLVRCESFVIERVRMADGVEQLIPYEELVVWIVLEGSGSVTCEGLRQPLTFGVGDTVVLPAAMKNGRVSVHERSMWLEVSVPIESSLAGFDRPDRSALREPPGPSFVALNLPHRDAARRETERNVE